MLLLKIVFKVGRGGGQVVSVLAFYSDDPCSNPAEVYNLSVKMLLKRTKINKKETRVGPFFKKTFKDWLAYWQSRYACSSPSFKVIHTTTHDLLSVKGRLLSKVYSEYFRVNLWFEQLWNRHVTRNVSYSALLKFLHKLCTKYLANFS